MEGRSYYFPSSRGRASVSNGRHYHYGQLEEQCSICRRLFPVQIELVEGFEGTFVCSQCEDDTDTSTSPAHSRRRHNGRQSRSWTSGSILDMFSRLTGLAGLGSEGQADGRTSHGSSRSHSRSRRWRRVVSDYDSDNVSQADSVFGESDSVVSFDDYGSDFDASIDGYSIHDIQGNNRSHAYDDADIDPMHAGLDQWVSGDDEYGEWDDAIVGDRGNYFEGRGNEELFEQSAENDNPRHRSCLVSASNLRKLPTVIVSYEHEKNGSVVCPVCMDALPLGTKAKELDCNHLFHKDCIVPWLETNNTCPVCRFELPTDNQEDNGEDAEDDADDAGDNSDVANANVGGNSNLANGSHRGSSGRRWYLPIVGIVGMVLVMWLQNYLAINDGRKGHGCQVGDFRSNQSATTQTSRRNRGSNG